MPTPPDPHLIEQACRLRAERWTYEAIGEVVGRSDFTVRTWIAKAQPELLDVKVDRTGIGGSAPGRGQKLTDAQLRVLHLVHDRDNTPVEELARQVVYRAGFASVRSAAVSIARGWRKLGLGIATERGRTSRRCTARVRSGPRRGGRCLRYATVGSDLCPMHRYATDAAAHARLMRAA